MVEAGVVERRRRLEAGDVAAEFGRFLVGAQHHRHRVPADDRADAVLDRAVAGMRRLLLDRDGVDVGRVRRERDLGAAPAGAVDDAARAGSARAPGPRPRARRPARPAIPGFRAGSVSRCSSMEPPTARGAAAALTLFSAPGRGVLAVCFHAFPGRTSLSGCAGNQKTAVLSGCMPVRHFPLQDGATRERPSFDRTACCKT